MIKRIAVRLSMVVGMVSTAGLRAQSASPQSVAGPYPKFDVVSIKPCEPGVQKRGDSSPGRLSVGCALLADIDNTGLIQVAYNRYAGGYLSSYRMIPIEGG